jgi:predicted nucleic acid-binding Zn ribbon protein
MATYIYETVPEKPGEAVRRFEVKQSMKDAPLTCEPETGKPVRRVITGGLAIMTGKRAQMTGQRAQTSCGSGRCGCC